MTIILPNKRFLQGIKMADQAAMIVPCLLAIWFYMLVLQAFSPVAYAQKIPGIPGIPQSDVTRMSDDLRDGGFTIAAVVVQALKSFVPYHTTMLIPSNDAIQSFSNVSASNIPGILQYHVIDFLASSRALSRAPVGARLPTLAPGKYVIVTSNETDNLSINNVKVVQPNLCQTTKFVTCHGISNVLDPTSEFATTPEISPVAAPQISPEAGGARGSLTDEANNVQDTESAERSRAPVSSGTRVGGVPAPGPSSALRKATFGSSSVCAIAMYMLGFIIATGSNLLF